MSCDGKTKCLLISITITVFVLSLHGNNTVLEENWIWFSCEEFRPLQWYTQLLTRVTVEHETQVLSLFINFHDAFRKASTHNLGSASNGVPATCNYTPRTKLKPYLRDCFLMLRISSLNFQQRDFIISLPDTLRNLFLKGTWVSTWTPWPSQLLVSSGIRCLGWRGFSVYYIFLFQVGFSRTHLIIIFVVPGVF